MSVIIVSGTDTNIGKTVVCAGLTHLLDGYYWKPIQSGLEGETDSQVVARLSGVPSHRILPEYARLCLPASPHFAAQQEGRFLDVNQLDLPSVPGPLIVEGAGGLLVPIHENTLQIDIFARWKAPLILCARTQVGTLNHTLLSLRALRDYGIFILGVVMIGPLHENNMETIEKIGNIRILAHIPHLPLEDPDLFRDSFREVWK